MINTKSVKWSEVSEESKREQWRLYHIYNTFGDEFFGKSFNSHDNCKEVETDEGVVWTYTWNDPSKAVASAENGLLKLPTFTKEHYSQDYYKQEVTLDENYYNEVSFNADDYTIENGEIVWLNKEAEERYNS
jgi:hypothetical protein